MDRWLRRALWLVEEFLYGGTDLLARAGPPGDGFQAEGEDPFDRPSTDI